MFNPVQFYEFGKKKGNIIEYIAYYKMQDNVNDSFASNNGTPTNITFEAGTVGKRAVFNGTSSLIQVNSNSSLNFGNGSVDRAFSVVFIVLRNALPGGGGYWFIDKRENTSTLQEWQIIELNGNISITLFSNSSGTNSIIAQIATPLTLGVSQTLVFTYDGRGVASGLKIYLDGNLLSTTNTTNGTYAAMSATNSKITMGRRGFTTNGYLNGKMDEVAIVKGAFNQSEITEIQTKFNNGQSLI